MTNSGTDSLDRKILGLLEADGRLTNSEIARRLHVSEALVRQRLRRLFNSATARLGIVVDFSIVDVRTIATIKVAIAAAHLDAAIKKLAVEPSIGLLLSTTGPLNVYIIITTRDQFELANVVDKKIRTLEGLQEFEISIISEAFKYDPRHFPSTTH
jgi:Lrp/AsnC family transcriptional regulator for asnA, asnC and gidA